MKFSVVLRLFAKIEDFMKWITKLQTHVCVLFHYKTYLRLRLGRCNNLQSSYLDAVLAYISKSPFNLNLAEMCKNSSNIFLLYQNISEH